MYMRNAKQQCEPKKKEKKKNNNTESVWKIFYNKYSSEWVNQSWLSSWYVLKKIIVDVCLCMEKICAMVKNMCTPLSILESIAYIK